MKCKKTNSWANSVTFPSKTSNILLTVNMDQQKRSLLKASASVKHDARETTLDIPTHWLVKPWIPNSYRKNTNVQSTTWSICPCNLSYACITKIKIFDMVKFLADICGKKFQPAKILQWWIKCIEFSANEKLCDKNFRSYTGHENYQIMPFVKYTHTNLYTSP